MLMLMFFVLSLFFANGPGVDVSVFVLYLFFATCPGADLSVFVLFLFLLNARC